MPGCEATGLHGLRWVAPRALAAVAAWVALTGCGPSGPRQTVPTNPPFAPTTSSPAPKPPSTTTTPPPPLISTTLPTAPARLLNKGKTDRPLVALTFDAGSDAGNAQQILDILALNHIHATFGITGSWAQSNPELVRQIAAAGDQIVNHSWDHRSFTGYSTKTQPLTPAEITNELATTDDLIRRITGSGTAGWFRPPYGDRNATVDAVAGTAGYQYDLMWTVDTLGWEGVPTATVVQRVMSSAAPGEIVLMHVGSASTDAAALAAVISALRGQGYGFATVAEIA